MNLSLQRKLFLSFFAAASVLVFTVAGVMHYFMRDGFDNYKTQVRLHRLSGIERELVLYNSAGRPLKDLKSDGAWEDLLMLANANQDDSKPLPPYYEPMPQLGKNRHWPRYARGVTLLDVDGEYVAGEAVSEAPQLRYEIKNNSYQVIGYWLIRKGPAVDQDNLGKVFIAQQLKFLFTLMLIAAFLSILLAGLLSEHFKKPLLRLQNAFRKVALGQLDVRLDDSTSDEAGEIAKTFNTMTARLQDQAQARNQWVSNTSHELRTPLTILRMRNEAMRDGIIPVRPEEWQHNLKTIADLTNLVDDLQVVSRSTEGSLDLKKERINLNNLLSELIHEHQQAFVAQGLNLMLKDSLAPISLIVDVQRLTQVLRNVLVNSLRYTDSPGNVVVVISANKLNARIVVSDSAPAVSDDALSHLFERFYRCDSSRSRATGGSGLGLAICEGIVKAHGGKIFATHSDIGGVSVVIELPLA